MPSWSAGQPAALELTITSPLQPRLILDAARRCGFDKTNAEERKSEQHALKYAELGNHFLPVAFESFGASQI